MSGRVEVDFGEMGAQVKAGSKLAGTVTFPSGKMESPLAFAQWSTQGRGDQDQGPKIPVMLKMAPRSLRGLSVGAPAGPPSSLSGAHMMWFEAEIPYEPLSYQGKIISIHWHLVFRYQLDQVAKSDEFEFRVERPD